MLPPKTISEELTEIAIYFAGMWNESPFEILQKDIDDFILLVNHHIKMGRKTKKSTATKTGEERIRVNDATATGGWF